MIAVVFLATMVEGSAAESQVLSRRSARKVQRKLMQDNSTMDGEKSPNADFSLPPDMINMTMDGNMSMDNMTMGGNITVPIQGLIVVVEVNGTGTNGTEAAAPEQGEAPEEPAEPEPVEVDIDFPEVPEEIPAVSDGYNGDKRRRSLLQDDATENPEKSLTEPIELTLPNGTVLNTTRIELAYNKGIAEGFAKGYRKGYADGKDGVEPAVSLE